MNDKDGSRPGAKGSDPEATMLRMALPRVILRGVSGALFGRSVPVLRRMNIGRADDCDLVLDDPVVSRLHAEIERNFDEILIRDLKSANGTFVNGKRIREAQLHEGDQIAFDQQRFLVTAPGGVDQERAKRSPAAPSPVSVTHDMANKRRLRRIGIVVVFAASILLAWYLTH